MRGFEIVLGLLLVAAALTPLARKLDLPVAITHVVGGMLLAVVPLLRNWSLDPEVAFTLFVPPLLYWAALHTSLRDLRLNARALLLLAVGLVIITEVAVAGTARWLWPALGWAPAFVLGAVVAPPDAAVATAVAHRLGIPKRLVTLLEGETLFNDSAAFVTYNLAIAATVTGVFSVGRAGLQFGWAVLGGILFGVATAAVVMLLRRLIKHTEVENTLSLLTPFAAFLPAERVGASGVLSVLFAGLILGWWGPKVVAARTRIQAQGMWGILTFILEGLIFLLIGLKLGGLIAEQFYAFDAPLLLRTLIIAAVVIAVRIIWVFVSSWRPWRRKTLSGPGWKRLFFLGWCGMRGGDTLVTALALPLTIGGEAPFPFRSGIATVGFGVLAVTLVLQGLTLRPLVRLLGLSAHDPAEEGQELKARRHAAKAGRDALVDAAQKSGLPKDAVDRMTASHDVRHRTHAIHDTAAYRQADEHITKLEQETISAERAALLDLREKGTVSDDILRRIQKELDLEELRLQGDDES